MRPSQPDPKPAIKRTPDHFQIARRLYLARRRLFEKADALIESADPIVLALVNSIEQQEASQPIGLVPSSLNIETD